MSTLPRIATLSVVKKDASLGAAYPLNHKDTREVVIGRDQLCDIRLSIPQVSRKHARIDVQRDPNGRNCIWFTALSGKQPTYLNGTSTPPFEMVELYENDLISIGGRHFRFNYLDGENPHQDQMQAPHSDTFKSPRADQVVVTPISVKSRPHRTPLSSILSSNQLNKSSNASSRRISFATKIENIRHYTPGTKPNDFVNPLKQGDRCENIDGEDEGVEFSPRAVELDFDDEQKENTPPAPAPQSSDSTEQEQGSNSNQSPSRGILVERQSPAEEEQASSVQEAPKEPVCAEEPVSNTRAESLSPADKDEMQDEAEQNASAMPAAAPETCSTSPNEALYPSLPTPLKPDTPGKYYSAKMEDAQKDEEDTSMKDENHTPTPASKEETEKPDHLSPSTSSTSKKYTQVAQKKSPATPNFLGELEFDAVPSPPIRTTQVPEVESADRSQSSLCPTPDTQHEPQAQDVFEFSSCQTNATATQAKKIVSLASSVVQSKAVSDESDAMDVCSPQNSRKRPRENPSPQMPSKKMRCNSPSTESSEQITAETTTTEAKQVAIPAEEEKQEQFFTPRKTRRIQRKSTAKKNNTDSKTRIVSRHNKKQQMEVSEDGEEMADAQADTPIITPRRSARLRNKYKKLMEQEENDEEDSTIGRSTRRVRRRRTALL